MACSITLVAAACFFLRNTGAMGSKSTKRLNIEGNLVPGTLSKEPKIDDDSRSCTRKWIPSDIVRNVIAECCDDRGICYLSETNKANQDTTKETRYVRKAQSIRHEMQKALRKLQEADKELGDGHQSRMLQQALPETAVWECLLGFDGYILNHKNYVKFRRFSNCNFIIHQAERILNLTTYYRRTFPSHVATPYHRLDEVRGNISESTLCLFDEYVALYQMASELTDQAKEHESVSRFYIIPIMGDIGNFIGYPNITMGSTLHEYNPFDALLTKILPGISKGVDIWPFVDRVKAFQAKVLQRNDEAL